MKQINSFNRNYSLAKLWIKHSIFWKLKIYRLSGMMKYHLVVAATIFYFSIYAVLFILVAIALIVGAPIL